MLFSPFVHLLSIMSFMSPDCIWRGSGGVNLVLFHTRLSFSVRREVWLELKVDLEMRM